ncbi:hypothetical protein [Salinirussus salinus]|uniref:hypothetical protein n=1 Tax=Salinirussus salinus TaxID=1198300 RepID=UPI001356BCD6|nr:hypothetical protein [Salinirussus salinus]
MREPDPEDLYSHHNPALVDVKGQGAVFVAKASTCDDGWLRVREWTGVSVKLPPRRVNQVRYLETERYGEPRDDGMKPVRLADEEYRELARQWVDEEEDEQPQVVA